MKYLFCKKGTVYGDSSSEKVLYYKLTQTSIPSHKQDWKQTIKDLFGIFKNSLQQQEIEIKGLLPEKVLKQLPELAKAKPQEIHPEILPLFEECTSSPYLLEQLKKSQPELLTSFEELYQQLQKNEAFITVRDSRKQFMKLYDEHVNTISTLTNKKKSLSQKSTLLHKKNEECQENIEDLKTITELKKNIQTLSSQAENIKEELELYDEHIALKQQEINLLQARKESQSTSAPWWLIAITLGLILWVDYNEVKIDQAQAKIASLKQEKEEDKYKHMELAFQIKQLKSKLKITEKKKLETKQSLQEQIRINKNDIKSLEGALQTTTKEIEIKKAELMSLEDEKNFYDAYSLQEFRQIYTIYKKRITESTKDINRLLRQLKKQTTKHKSSGVIKLPDTSE